MIVKAKMFNYHEVEYFVVLDEKENKQKIKKQIIKVKKNTE